MINKKQIVKYLEEIALSLELLQENAFKVSSYRKAARAIENLQGDFMDLLEQKKIQNIKGIGQAISKKIYDYYENQKDNDYLKNLKNKIPNEIFNILKINGLGTKKVIDLWKKLGVTTLGELEYACRENRLVSLSGFGKKTQGKVLQQINELKKLRGHSLLNEAENEINRVSNILEKDYGINKIKVAGAFRRGMPIVDEIIFIMESDKNINNIESGLNLKFVNANSNDFNYLLFLNTGNREHIEKIKIKNEHYSSEKEIYEKAGLQFIPPELRENCGEIESAKKGKIPELIEQSNIKGIIHAHTTFSDGSNTLEEMAQACINKGYNYLCVSDHSKSAFYAGGLTIEDIKKQQREIKELNNKYGNFKIFSGIESDILKDGSLDYDDEILSMFDFVIASIHSTFSLPEEEMTSRIIKAVKNPHTTILGHISGRLLLGRKGYEINHEKIINHCIDNKVVIEINANPHRLDIDWRYIKNAKEKGALFSINPDAHAIKGIDHVKYGIITAKKGWLEPKNVINTMNTNEIENFFKERIK